MRRPNFQSEKCLIRVCFLFRNTEIFIFIYEKFNESPYHPYFLVLHIIHSVFSFDREMLE